MSKLPRANKDLGQHFLRDKNIIEKIGHDFAQRAQAIVEVGPGPAILTPTLRSHDLPFLVIEKDQRFYENLLLYVAEENIVMGDCLECNITQELTKRSFPQEDVWLVSNLPYNISVPLTLQFIKTPAITFMSLMYQKEVADKIKPIFTKEAKAMSSLSALVQTYFECKILCKVPPGAFSPPPQVDSAVISFERKIDPKISLEEFSPFETFLRQLFQFKRKQVHKNLKGAYNAEELQHAFEITKLSPQARAESFSLEDVQALYLALRIN